MAKDKERRLARELYVNQQKTAKEIAESIGVSEKTVGSWVKKYNWRDQRDAVQNAPDKTIMNLKDLINQLTEQRMELQREQEPTDPKEASELAARKARLADEISKWTKALEAAKKDNQISLAVYIKVMESVFCAIQKAQPKLYLQLLDFQEEHLQEVANKY